jgi:hypothetical protein
MYPQEPNQNPTPGPMPPPGTPEYDPRSRVDNALSVTQPGEVTICEVKRHPIGILGIYVAIGVLLLVVAVLAFVLAPTVITDSSQSHQAMQWGVVALFILAVICGLYGLIATKVYWGNRWVVTSDSVTQISQTSLFNRQSAQLALANIEDVTAEQNGILAHMFNYGVLKAETAGHRSKFVFTYCPNPNFYAQQILTAREALGSAGHHGGQQPPAGPPTYS